jgi:hypothetical protein
MKHRRSRILLEVIQLLLLGFLLHKSVYSQPIQSGPIDGVYTGTIGKQQIVLEIGAVDPHRNDRTCTEAPDQTGWHTVCFNHNDGPDQPIEGRYFYRQHGIAILVEGTILSDGSLRIQEYQHSKPSGAEWRLHFQESKVTGFFCRCNVRDQAPAAGSVANIFLTRVSRGFDPGLSTSDSNRHAPDQAYYELLLDFPLRTTSEVKVSQGAGYVVETDPRFKVSLPHLIDFPDPNITDRINRDLSRRLEKARLEAAFCLQGIDFRGGEWNENLRVARFRDTLSIVREVFYSCGGLHPDAVTEPLVYDLQTGRLLDLKDFFRVQPESAVLEDGVVPAGPVHSLLLSLYRRHYVKPSDECETENFNSDTTLKMYFDQRGLVIVPELSHVDQGCGPKIAVSYQELRPYRRL